MKEWSGSIEKLFRVGEVGSGISFMFKLFFLVGFSYLVEKILKK